LLPATQPGLDAGGVRLDKAAPSFREVKLRRSLFAFHGARDVKCLALTFAICTLGSQAQGFDCAKATSRFEKAICGDAHAHDADIAMSKAFSDLLSGVDAKARAAATAAQIAWIKDRDRTCGDKKAGELASCLTSQSESRRAFLSGQPQEGPGAASRIVPWFRIEKGGRGKADVDMELLKFADPKSPGERAFNAATAKFLEDIIEPEKDDPAADNYAFETRMTLVYASPKLVSAQASGYTDSGGAHPNSYVANVNYDVAADRLLKFQDAFDAKAAQKIYVRCGDQVKAQKKERMGSDAPLAPDDLKELAKNIADSTGDLANWSLGATKADVVYNPYAVGSYAEGAYDCELGYDLLRSLVKPGFPLP
jgi:uncharacterized protein YecT (DUF1311 family)